MGRGGARPGAGRPRKAAAEKPKGHTDSSGRKLPSAPDSWPFGVEPPPAPAPPPAETPRPVVNRGATSMEFLQSVMWDEMEDMRNRMQAARDLLAYEHAKKGAGGKKEDASEKAKKAAANKFASAAPPKLVVSNK